MPTGPAVGTRRTNPAVAEISRIGRITPAGVITTFGDPAGSSSTDSPSHITVGADGNLWYASGNSQRVGRLLLDPSDATCAAETIDAGDGSHTVRGGRGDDIITGGTDRDTCKGQTGVDIARSCEVVTGVP